MRISGPASGRSWIAMSGRWSTSRRRRAVPRGAPEGDGQRRAARPGRTRGVRWRWGRSLAITVLAEELARASGGLAITAPGEQLHGDPAHRAVRHRRPEGPVPARASRPGEDRVDRGDRARHRVERRRHHHPGHPGEGEGGYRLDGTKMFITNAGIADVLVVAGRPRPTATAASPRSSSRQTTRAVRRPAAPEDGLARVGHPRGRPGRLLRARGAVLGERTVASTRS